MTSFDPYDYLYNSSTTNNLRFVQGVALDGFIEAMANATKSSKIIIPMSHYPLKCSASAKNCQDDTKLLKDFFDIMFKNNVNFYIGAHYHTY